MRVSIITPCFNASPWIGQCVDSVRAQFAEDRDRYKKFMMLHHHVQDGGSNDGTVDCLERYAQECHNAGADKSFPKATNLKSNAYSFSYKSERDNGMYNALNKAFAVTAGEVVGHLNADEQYFPETLHFVAEYFHLNPEVDVLFGAVVVVDAEGSYICSRIPMKPQLLHTQICHLSTFTASMFFRRSAIEKLGVYFDETFQTAGDADLICRMLNAGLNMATTRRYFSVFVDSGDNLALSSQAASEQERMSKLAPKWAQKMPRIIEICHRVRKLLSGAYRLKPFKYQFIDAHGSIHTHWVEFPTGRWLNRLY